MKVHVYHQILSCDRPPPRRLHLLMLSIQKEIVARQRPKKSLDAFFQEDTNQASRNVLSHPLVAIRSQVQPIIPIQCALGLGEGVVRDVRSQVKSITVE